MGGRRSYLTYSWMNYIQFLPPLSLPTSDPGRVVVGVGERDVRIELPPIYMVLQTNKLPMNLPLLPLFWHFLSRISDDFETGWSRIRSRGCWLWIHKGPRDVGGADPVDQTQIKSRCLQGGCFSSQDPKRPQRNRVHGRLLSQLHIAVGEGLHTISGNLHRPLKVRSFLFFFLAQQPSSPPWMCEKAKEGLRGAAGILLSAKQPFLSLVFVSDLPAPNERETPNPHPGIPVAQSSERPLHTLQPPGHHYWVHSLQWGPGIFFKGLKKKKKKPCPLKDQLGNK